MRHELTKAEVMRKLGLSEQHFYMLRKPGTNTYEASFPLPHKNSDNLRCLMWYADDIDNFIANWVTLVYPVDVSKRVFYSFYHWAKAEGYDVSQYQDGSFLDRDTVAAFDGWINRGRYL